jgi:hypothetical protein
MPMPIIKNAALIQAHIGALEAAAKAGGGQ